MKHKILSKPSYSLLEIEMEPGEEILAEAGAMVYMKGVELKTEVKGGLFGGLKRMIAGESFFINRYRAVERDAVVGLAPSYQGDVIHLEIDGRIYAQSGAFLASSPGIDIDSKWGGAKSFFAGEGLILLRIEGVGDVFLSSFGGIIEREVKGKFVIDTGHIVAFDDSLDFKVRRAGGLKSTIFSGEGLVVEFKGNGRVWIQTRSISDYIGWLSSLLPKRD